MTQAVAVVGMACRYPDASSPGELWESVLAQRRAFRRMPQGRLRLEDYFSSDRNAPDSVYSSQAALITDYEFDRVKFRIAGSTFRSADPTHWLALDVAASALADAGFEGGTGRLRDTTGVFVGNTLTGEFSRAAVLRLRWPYVRRVVEAELIAEGWPSDKRRPFMQRLEALYKKPFPEVGEESLAGGLSNTIAGRICNHFNFKGAGYTVDGACASSLLAVINACSALAAGDVDVALAGGVDLSMDPFELVGFAKTSALATDEMRVYDARSSGFWPGEGCGFVVLMRYEDALALCRKNYALIRGWGISSDGSGGITRPEVEGQLLALERAYRRAGFGIQTVGYFEGHGTGTSVGDATELKALSIARRGAGPEAPAAVVSSVKSNIGHTKAAAGIAGLIKSVMALDAQILPPTAGCQSPHPELCGERPALRVLQKGEPWPADIALRAGVSAMGFGGINTHVVLEATESERRKRINPRECSGLSSAQDAELFLIAGKDRPDLMKKLVSLSSFAAGLSYAEMTDLAVELSRNLKESEQSAGVRAAVVASSPSELKARLEILQSWLAKEEPARLAARSGVFLGEGSGARIGFLFPGQGSPVYLNSGAWGRRFESLSDLYSGAEWVNSADKMSTATAQPAVVSSSITGLRVLDRLGISAIVAVGHSLGELTALHWAGAYDERSLVELAAARGQAMFEHGSVSGAMASIGAGEAQVRAMLNGERVFIAAFNSPLQTVISGEAAGVAALLQRAKARRLPAVMLPVARAFHSPLVAPSARVIAEFVNRQPFRPLNRAVISTVTGSRLKSDEDLKELLYRQVSSPVRFHEAITLASVGLDLWVEVGPGDTLSGIASDFLETPVISLDAGGESLKGLLSAVAATFVLGAPLRHEILFSDRFSRPFKLDWNPKFFANPCEMAPIPEDSFHFDAEASTAPGDSKDSKEIGSNDQAAGSQGASALELVKRLVAKRTELPVDAVTDDLRLLADLHLNSITVSQMVGEAARAMQLPPPVAPTDYSSVTVAEVARALEDLMQLGVTSPSRHVTGVDSWVRCFTVDLVERPVARRKPASGSSDWSVIAPAGDPMAAPLLKAFSEWGAAAGVVVCLPPEAGEPEINLLLEGARLVLSQKGKRQFVLVQRRVSAAGFAKSLHLEDPEIDVTVVTVPEGHADAVRWALGEAQATTGYSEACYDESGVRREPVLNLLPDAEGPAEHPLGPLDVMLVTGGGKGIASECALSLAKECGVRLVLLGRSSPEQDAELAANLERMKAAGARVKYIAADVCDLKAVERAVNEAVADFGPVTAVLHAAGTNVPRSLRSLDADCFLETLAPKIQGARNILASVDPNQLRLFVCFGSLIARTGMQGEADYALANEWLRLLVERRQQERPGCRFLNVEWSIWSGVGMGERLGRVDALMHQGITPITPDEGIRILKQLLCRRLPSSSVVVSGRFGEAPTLRLNETPLPFLRFLEHTKLHYPMVELIVEADLSNESDPYLEEHAFQGNPLFPAVMGLEAMAQTAMAVAGSPTPPAFEGAVFARPIVVPYSGKVRIRVAALARGPGRVEVAIRSEETAFQVDHFRALCVFGASGGEADTGARADAELFELPFVRLNVGSDLYDEILFHEGRFRRVAGYRFLSAKQCVAEVDSNVNGNWFGRYLPPTLVLGDPGCNDAAIHAVQACIPHALLLPVGVDRLRFGAQKQAGPHFVHARERERDGKDFIYDIEVRDAEGGLRERWEGLRLRQVAESDNKSELAEPLFINYVERKLEELIPWARVRVGLECDASIERSQRRGRAIRQAVGSQAAIYTRPDGRPELSHELSKGVSVSHMGRFTVAAAGPNTVTCDAEAITGRPASVWRDLLDRERFALAEVLAREVGEELETSATRVWTACECLKKAGAMIDAPLILSGHQEDWVLLASGQCVIATVATGLRSVMDRFVLGVLVKNATL